MFIDHTLYVDSTWEFLRLILDLSMKVLKQDGKYFTQVWYLDVKEYCCISMIVIYILQICLFLKNNTNSNKANKIIIASCFLTVICLGFLHEIWAFQTDLRFFHFQMKL